MGETKKRLQCRRWEAAAPLRGPPSCPSAEHPADNPPNPQEEGLFETKRETSTKLKREFFPQLPPTLNPDLLSLPLGTACGPGSRPWPGHRAEPSAKVSGPGGAGPGRPGSGGAPGAGEALGRLPPPGWTAKLRPPAPPLRAEPAGPGGKYKGGRRAAEGEREGGGGRRGSARRPRGARPFHPGPQARPPQQKTPDPAASLPSAGGGRGGCDPELHYLVAKG